MRRNRKHTDHGDDIVQDGEVVRVSLTDAVRARGAAQVKDHLRALVQMAGHRPGPVLDALSATVTLDSSGDLRCLFDARDRAFADLEKRSADAWKNGASVAPPLSAMPEPNYDQEKPTNLNEALDAREKARIERDQRGDNAWRNPPSIYANTPNTLTPPRGGLLDPSRQPLVEALYEKTLGQR